MNNRTTRKIVRIDPDKCNGCGLCVPGCAEGAIKIIDGKAQLVAENLCDGLGNCLGNCPQDAIIIEERPADQFDHAAVNAHLQATQSPTQPADCSKGGGCPGSMLKRLKALSGRPETMTDKSKKIEQNQQPRPSQLGQWPVQLSLVPVSGPIWDGTDVLISADCVAFAMADFHERLLAGKTLAIACPKLDNFQRHLDKLQAIFAANPVRSVTIARMEVPCCGGLVSAVRQAMEQAGRDDIPVKEIIITVDGDTQEI